MMGDSKGFQLWLQTPYSRGSFMLHFEYETEKEADNAADAFRDTCGIRIVQVTYRRLSKYDREMPLVEAAPAVQEEA